VYVTGNRAQFADRFLKFLDFFATNLTDTNIQNNIRELEGALNKIIANHQLLGIPPNFEEIKKVLNSLTSIRFVIVSLSSCLFQTASIYSSLQPLSRAHHA